LWGYCPHSVFKLLKYREMDKIQKPGDSEDQLQVFKKIQGLREMK
jgi:hypothetical protein